MNRDKRNIKKGNRYFVLRFSYLALILAGVCLVVLCKLFFGNNPMTNLNFGFGRYVW